MYYQDWFTCSLDWSHYQARNNFRVSCNKFPYTFLQKYNLVSQCKNIMHIKLTSCTFWSSVSVFTLTEVRSSAFSMTSTRNLITYCWKQIGLRIIQKFLQSYTTRQILGYTPWAQGTLKLERYMPPLQWIWTLTGRVTR